MTTSSDWLNDTSHLQPGFIRPERRRGWLKSKWYRPPDLKLSPKEVQDKVATAEAAYLAWKQGQKR